MLYLLIAIVSFIAGWQAHRKHVQTIIRSIKRQRDRESYVKTMGQ